MTTFDDLFPGDEEFYPGSKKKRKEKANSNVEFIPDEWRDNYNLKTINGQEVRMYTIGALATALGVSVPAIRKWIKLGYLPQAPYRLPSNMVVNGQKVSGRRLYTEETIQAVVDIFEEEGVLGSSRIDWGSHEEIPIKVIEAWQDLLNQNK